MKLSAKFLVSAVAMAAMAATTAAIAGTVIRLDAPVVVSTADPANNAYKAKMGWISYKSSTAQPQYDVKAQIMVYADGPANGQNIWIARSIDNGATWSQRQVTSSGTITTRVVTDPVTLSTGNFTVNHNKPNIYVAPIGVIVNGKGADALLTWTSSDCSDHGNVAGDLPGPTPAQRINTPLNQPFMCLWTARSVDGGVNWIKQRLTSGALDADEDVPAGFVKYTADTASTGGFAISYQADPAGLKEGEGEGPGDGASGATVNPGTNIWYTSLSKAAFENLATPFPPPTAVSNNTGVVEGDPGASRANLAISGGTAVLAYEETKWATAGKQIIYHSFPYATPDVNSAGTVISNPASNARRVRFVLQGNEALSNGGDAGAPGATTKGVHVLLLWRETGLTTPAAASDIMMLRGIRNTSARPGSTGFLPSDIEPFAAAKNLSDPSGDLTNDDNALAHRGVLRGEFAAVGFDRTPSKSLADVYLETYNFFILRSVDGGVAWSAPTNMSRITAPATRVVEPRVIGAPGTIKLPNGTATSDPSDVQNPNILVVAWGTETNAPSSLPLDIYMTRSTDKGASYEVVQMLAGGAAEQSEAQLRSPPDGMTLGALWMERSASANTTDVVYRNGAAATIVVSTSTMELSSAVNPAAPGTMVSIVAAVAGDMPTGTVTFTENGAVVTGCGELALTGTGNTRTATCKTSNLFAGTHALKGSYSGDLFNTAAVSTVLWQTIGLPGQSALPLYRFNTGTNHFYTISESEKAYVQQTFPTWSFEGIAYFVYPAGVINAAPVYRFNTGTYHFYTISPAEKAMLQATFPQWTYEGIAFYAYPGITGGASPVYRFNTGSSHFYTISEAEKAYVLKTFPSWVLEGVAYYARTAP